MEICQIKALPSQTLNFNFFEIVFSNSKPDVWSNPGGLFTVLAKKNAPHKKVIFRSKKCFIHNFLIQMFEDGNLLAVAFGIR